MHARPWLILVVASLSACTGGGSSSSSSGTGGSSSSSSSSPSSGASSSGPASSSATPSSLAPSSGTAVSSSAGATSGASSTSSSAPASSSTASSAAAPSSSLALSSSSSAANELDTILAALRTSRDTTLLAYANTRGWPVALASGGYLFVTVDTSLPNVAGDFNAWASTPMTDEGRFAWVVATARAGDHYKFTNGTQYAADPWARSYWYDNNGEISWITPAETHLDRFNGIGDAVLQPRTVRVLVPAGTPTHVLYAHDGQNLFDPQGPWGGWKLQDTAPAGMMIVGIDSTSSRMDEYTHVPDDIGGMTGGLGASYAAFIQDTVRPLVRAQYGAEAPRVGTLGSSLGGLISLYIASRYPGEYDFAGSLSGTMGWGSIGAGIHNTTLMDVYAAAGHGTTALYLDSGGGGTTCADSDSDGVDDDDPADQDNYCENLQMHRVLVTAGYVDGTDVFHWYEPGATHDEAAWAARVFRPLQTFDGM